jgi:molybdopterin synthase sulfur carrier subunit
MTAKVIIPTPLRNLTGGASAVSIDAGTVGQVLEALEAAHPGFHERLFDERGDLRRFVNIFVNGEDIRFLEGQETLVAERDEVSIVPAVAGGC